MSWKSPDKIELSGEGVTSMSPEAFRTLAAELGARGIVATCIYEPDREQLIRPRLCTLAEASEFAQALGFKPREGMGARRFMTIVRAPKTIAQRIQVNTLADYAITAEELDEADGRIRVVHALSTDEFGIDTLSLRDNVSAWLNNDPGIRTLGPKGISFWAEYCNQAMPELEPLPVTYPTAR